MRLAQTQRQVITMPWHQIDNDLFEFLAPGGEYPLILSGLAKKIQFPWDPKFFMSYPDLAEQMCTVQNCRTGETYSISVYEFFSSFGHDSENQDVLRLKVGITIAEIYSRSSANNVCTLYRIGRRLPVLRPPHPSQTFAVIL
jgi:hypothetical protein